jgi:2-(1,2-epoxy-1,2-dihydrophenyl)acetyl-CoA isomerase
MSVDLSVENGLAEIVLNRPDKMNALNDAMVAELNGALERAASQGVRAIMIRGEGPAFSAGRDLADAHPGDEDSEAIIETTFNPLIKRIVSFPAPTFAAVHGACLGVGLGLALGCDVVYVADDAKIGSPFARIGAVLDSGGHSFFVSRLGTHRALELIYTFRRRSLTTGTGQSEHAERFAGRGDSEDRGAGCTRTDRGLHAVEAPGAQDR